MFIYFYHEGICLQLTEECAFLNANFNSMYSSKFCGSRAADFLGSVSDAACVIISVDDLEFAMLGYDQFFRRLLLKVGASNDSKKKFYINFFVKSGEQNIDSLDPYLSELLKTIWCELGKEVYLSI